MTDLDTPLAFEPLDDHPGFEIVDRIERHRCEIRTSGPTSPTEVDPAAFQLPVDRAVSVETEHVVIPTGGGAVQVRDDAGEIIGQVELFEEESLPEGSYSLEILGQSRSFVKVESAIEISIDAMAKRIKFDRPTETLIGARSTHDRPAATVTTTEDPVNMMAAVETFSSSLKTTTPDRAFGWLRGHPPAVELGEQLDIPSGLDRPETGVTLELPARHEAIFVAAPLAYYLAADIEPGPVPTLRTDHGFEYPLAGTHDFETTVERTLKQVFFLDCVTRTEGIYDVDLRERNEIEPRVDLDFATLYEQSLADQVAAYLEVPYEVLEDQIPDWRLTTHVEPDPTTIEQLPFVVDDLAIVRTPSASQVTAPAAGPTEGLARGDVFTRSASGEADAATKSYVEPETSGSLEQAWIGEEIPIGASKLTREAFDNRIDREPTDGDISITIVLNDPRMEEEQDLVDRAYGNREALPFDVTVHRDLTTDGLREVLHRDTAFLHYIGHTERDGFECTDGKLDVTTLERAGVEAFLLNACNSYDQGLGLIEAGAVGGIVTLNDVINEGAVRIGESVARLLNSGFPLRAALTIAKEESVLGGQYIVVGDGSMTVAQPASGTACLLDVTPLDNGQFEIEMETYVSDVNSLGTIFWPHLDDNDEFFLSSGRIGPFTLSTAELSEFVEMEDAPIRIDGELDLAGSIDLARFSE